MLARSSIIRAIAVCAVLTGLCLIILALVPSGSVGRVATSSAGDLNGELQPRVIARAVSDISSQPELLMSPRRSAGKGGAKDVKEESLGSEQVNLGHLDTPIAVPPLEMTRRTSLVRHSSKALDDPKLIMGGEGSKHWDVDEVEFGHFLIFADFTQGLIFKLKNVRGRIIRIDIDQAPMPKTNLLATTPVYADGAQYATLEELAMFRDVPKVARITASNGAIVPVMTASGWTSIPNVWADNRHTYSFVCEFSQDEVFVSLRTPRSATYNDRYFRLLAANERARVVQFGVSGDGRPLRGVEIGVDGSGTTGKPCVLVYAGEHADEYDSMWVAEGVIEYLLSDAPGAAAAREDCMFIVIPCMDPEATFAGEHEIVTRQFTSGSSSLTAQSYAAWFAARAKSGGRIDLVLNLHSGTTAVPVDVACALAEADARRGGAAIGIHAEICDALSASGYRVEKRLWSRGWSTSRLAGWLAKSFGAIGLAYEINGQNAAEHRTVAELRSIGSLIAERTAVSMRGDVGKSITAIVDDCRRSVQPKIDSLPMSGKEILEATKEIDAALAVRGGNAVEREVQ